jgi:pimeloyl-ACP methyl ester carboxylesterase
MQSRIVGPTMPVLEFTLDSNEAVISEAGELSWMSSAIQLTTHTQLGGGGGLLGALKRVAGGGTLFMTEYRAVGAAGELAFEMNEQGAFLLDLGRLAAFDRPALISRGDQSPPFFGTILDIIGETLAHARRHIFNGAGHVPHLTHPDDFVSVVGGLIGTVATARP